MSSHLKPTTGSNSEVVRTFGWRCEWTWWLHDQLRHILSLRRSFLTPPQLHAHSSRYIAAKTTRGKRNRCEWTQWAWFVVICSKPFGWWWVGSATYVYKLQILKRQIGSGTSSSWARLVVAATSAALVSLVFQALPQTVMELPPLLPVRKEAKLIVKQPDHKCKI